MPMINEAVFALGEGVATMQDIDAGCRLGLNHPMGPITLADFIGLDTCLEIIRVLYTAPAIRNSAPRRCSSNMSMRAGSAKRPGAASTTGLRPGARSDAIKDKFRSKPIL
jgi:3-hydroxyacyl-CoA dehydrogenase